MSVLERNELKEMLEEDEDFVLINVLSPESFEDKHIPGSINVPIDEDFEENINEKVPDKDEKIVVYCASFECQASTKAAQKLEELGYTNVYDYEGGVKDWEEAGNELEGKSA